MQRCPPIARAGDGGPAVLTRRGLRWRGSLVRNREESSCPPDFSATPCGPPSNLFCDSCGPRHRRSLHHLARDKLLGGKSDREGDSDRLALRLPTHAWERLTVARECNRRHVVTARRIHPPGPPSRARSNRTRGRLRVPPRPGCEASRRLAPSWPLSKPLEELLRGDRPGIVGLELPVSVFKFGGPSLLVTRVAFRRRRFQAAKEAVRQLRASVSGSSRALAKKSSVAVLIGLAPGNSHSHSIVPGGLLVTS